MWAWICRTRWDWWRFFQKEEHHCGIGRAKAVGFQLNQQVSLLLSWNGRKRLLELAVVTGVWKLKRPWQIWGCNLSWGVYWLLKIEKLIIEKVRSWEYDVKMWVIVKKKNCERIYIVPKVWVRNYKERSEKWQCMPARYHITRCVFLINLCWVFLSIAFNRIYFRVNNITDIGQLKGIGTI